MAKRWETASYATKLELLIEHDALPRGNKGQWLKKRGITPKQIAYLRNQQRKDAGEQGAASLVPYVPPRHAGEQDPKTLLALYEAAPHKGRFLEEHGLYKSWPSNLRYRLAKQQQRPVTQARQMNVLPSAAPGPSVTLEDAIAALQVRQDIMSEFIDILKRMSQGSRG